MDQQIILRNATLADLELLLRWRNDLQTRQQSHNSELIELEPHGIWLRSSLSDPNRKLYIAEVAGNPLGTVRVDFLDGKFEISWTIAPTARGKGFGKKIVSLVANQISGEIRAEIKVGNIASIKIAEHAGMLYEREENGILHFSRKARPIDSLPEEFPPKLEKP